MRAPAGLLGIVLLTVATAAAAQTLYKYRGDDGEWIFSDRPPVDVELIDETRTLSAGADRGLLTVTTRSTADGLEFVASNRFHAPVELALRFKVIEGFELPDPDAELLWVVPPLAEVLLVTLVPDVSEGAPSASYEYEYMVGSPDAEHRPVEPYRVPFAISTNYPVTQAYPDVITHQTPDSFYAIDIAMPIGTNIFAARAGIVFDVASDNYAGGTDREEHGQLANVVQILHDDGTFAIYAHLNWNSIRVRPGQRVVRGEYIADSGNTGFSSGPHLHFAVLRNRGLELESLPVRFEGANASGVVPTSGTTLTAY
ncbi:MAG: M23 family metallopeptidase [Pseudomonadota bacterium]